MISRLESSAASYYIYDGGLSVRALTNKAGTVTDTLVFDAFGNETFKTGSTDNSYGFQGEEKDETGLYYLRARYMDPSTGTFTSMDTYGGSLSDPMSLHKYMFANSNPVMYSDPSGHFSLMEMDASMAIDYILNAGYMSGYLYIIDANITDPNLEHHNFMGYLGAIGAGMLFATMGLVLSATVTGLLILAIIDTLLGVAGTVKGVIDILNGHPLYGGIEIVGSAVLVWFGWRNYAGARQAAKVSGQAQSEQSGNKTDNTKQRISNKFPGDKQSGKELNYSSKDGKIYTENGIREVDFVIDMNDNLHIGRGHSYLSGGQDVQAAGTMKINSQGIIRNITNESGHYRPNATETRNFPRILKESGFNADNAWIRISGFKVDATNYVTDSWIIYNGPVKYMPDM